MNESSGVDRARQWLAVYLNDHLAGATAGVELAKRVARVHQHSEHGPGLGSLANDVELDRQSLLRFMELLDVPVRRYKAYEGWAAEKAGRLKLNGRLLRSAALSTAIELEGLLLVVDGKTLLWQTLGAVATRDTRLDPKRLEELHSRAVQQRETLRALHMVAAQRLASPQFASEGAPLSERILLRPGRHSEGIPFHPAGEGHSAAHGCVAA
ncbi:hypothetical protein OG302_01835 [Streptomyces sp. NBC_01283]|uniref:hypothetical protein n=1 Tax=Streptomyces sp. NBC_01283 TaxID=2903812 RepID=UPI00352EFFFB|nr:hypothetical protein OG302_01835 [Streptomyces sp. NBC_01283]